MFCIVNVLFDFDFAASSCFNKVLYAKYIMI